MLNGRAPYDMLLTHGFVLDGENRKMSKSLGNVISPLTICNTLGADILRLWVASTDYSSDVSLSDTILKRGGRKLSADSQYAALPAVESGGLRPGQHATRTRTLARDRPLCSSAHCTDCKRRCCSTTRNSSFHLIASKLQSYCSEDLGGFYLDVLKDRLYTSAKHAEQRRSAQNALWHITHALLRLFAPILSFTAEEAFGIFAKANENRFGTVFAETYHRFPEIAGAIQLIDKWERIRAIRGDVSKRLEEVRSEGRIGASLAGRSRAGRTARRLRFARVTR